MGYNWEKIFKSKTNKELYDIVISKVNLNDQAQYLAEKELKSRGFDFDKIDKYKKNGNSKPYLKNKDLKIIRF